MYRIVAIDILIVIVFIKNHKLKYISVTIFFENNGS